jgi:XTP/dITP diphosphohydrolase
MHEPSELLVATNNAGKVRELSQLLSGLPLALRTLSEWPDIPEAVETETTFAANAALKALYYSSRSGMLTLSDDSGLEVEALGGAPGVYSARYAGAGATYVKKMAKLLDALAASGDRARRARFVCVIAIANPSSGELHTFEGKCEGSIAQEPRGSGGFGYDPVFIPEGHTQTFGELPDETKHRISHRARALAQAIRFLHERFQRPGLTRD